MNSISDMLYPFPVPHIRVSRLWIAFVAVCLMTPTSTSAASAQDNNDPVAHQTTTTFNSCTPSEIDSLNTDVSNASTLANEAYDYFAKNRAGARYAYWFGTFNTSRWNTVKEKFRNIANLFTVGNVKFDCTMPSSCTGSYGFVYPNDNTHTIYVCTMYLSAPATGTDSRAGTLIHLGGQFNDVGSNGSYAYGQAASHGLAGTNPTNAIANSDNFEYFAENTPATADNAAAYTVGTLLQAFPDTSLGMSSSPLQFSLTNSGDANLNISSITTNGDFTASGGTCSSGSIAPNATCTFSTTFTPRALGAHTSVITIAANTNVTPTAIIISGAGTAAPVGAPSTTSESTPVSTTPPITVAPVVKTFATKVKVSAIARASKLRVVVSNAIDSGQRTFTVQVRKKSRWTNYKANYTTKGRRDLNLPKGVYRVLVMSKGTYLAVTSAPVSLKK